MEAGERPSKLRKLDSHDGLNSQTATVSDRPLLPAVLPAVDVNAANTDDANISTSKPDEHEHAAANVADPSEGDVGADDLEGSVRSEPDPDQRDGPSEPASEPQPEPTQPISKNQLKKLRKREEWEAGREYRKAKRKQKLQEKRARKRAAREDEEGQHEHEHQNGETLVSTPTTTTALQHQDGNQNSLSKPRPRRPVQLPVTIIIDCGFDELMMEKERISLGSQITRSYSDNSRAPFQAHLVITSWGGLLKKRFDTVMNKHYLNWKGVTLLEDDFVEAARRADEVMKSPKGGKLVGFFAKYAAGQHGGQVNVDDATPAKSLLEDSKQALQNSTPAPENANAISAPPSDQQTSDQQHESSSKDEAASTLPNLESAQKEQTFPGPGSAAAPAAAAAAAAVPPTTSGEVVYLTSDSPDTLTELHPFSTYIVGGLVDKNRHKGICYKIARERGIKTAKLPIGEYMDMQSRKVLATNHVVEIMIRWLECGDWGEAFMKVIPKRKGGKLRGHEEERTVGSAASNEDDDQGREADELDNERRDGQLNQ